MDHGPVASRREGWPYISRFQPGDDRLATRGRLGGLRKPHGVEDQARDRPPCDELEPDVGPPEEERSDEDDHVGIATGGDQPEPAVDPLPDVNMHSAEAL